MQSFGTLYVIFKKVICCISAIMLLIVGFDEKDLPDPDGAVVVDKNTYVLYDRHMSSQGVTNDGEYFYFSGKKNLGKAKIEDGKIFLIMTNSIPDVLEEIGCNHIGGITYYKGMIYAAVEDGPDYKNPYIALYDAETLEFTGKYYRLDPDLHKEGVPWCAVDVEKGYLYTAEWSNATVLNVYKLDDLSFVKTIKLSVAVDRIQGAEMFDGKLYMSCDEENDMKRILSVDVESGKVETAFTRNIGVAFEAEDMTIYQDKNGEPVFCVLDRGERRKSTNLTMYQLEKN